MGQNTKRSRRPQKATEDEIVQLYNAAEAARVLSEMYADAVSRLLQIRTEIGVRAMQGIRLSPRKRAALESDVTQMLSEAQNASTFLRRIAEPLTRPKAALRLVN